MNPYMGVTQHSTWHATQAGLQSSSSVLRTLRPLSSQLCPFHPMSPVSKGSSQVLGLPGASNQPTLPWNSADPLPGALTLTSAMQPEKQVLLEWSWP